MKKTKPRAPPAPAAPATAAPPETQRRPRHRGRTGVPVVGIGASAGGLEAFTQLLGSIPGDTGMAFVLVQHLDPTHESLLSETLARATPMPVAQVGERTRVQANHVYVIPPNAELGILGGLLTLLPRHEEPGRPHLPIDFFLRALAAEQGGQAIGVVLSGTGSDGTEGLRAIKEEDGITFVQEPATAKFDGMPRSALDAGVADASLPVADIARELVRLSRHPYLTDRTARRAPDGDPTLDKIFVLVRAAAGIDFSEYKPASVTRRLTRRMALQRVATREDYLRLLQGSPEEARQLAMDVLIHVTSFFRDPDVFEALKERCFPEILAKKPADAPVRVWVAGCSTGEEVYSLAMVLLEFLGDDHSRTLQIFGSDVSEQAVATARAGVYPDAVMRDVGEERRLRFFSRVERGWRINKDVRDRCVFVRHDLARDPPFSRLDLVSCRNVLIYFGAALQKRVLGAFHYCLSQPGFLLLGRTETVSGFAPFFTAADQTHNIFARTDVPSTMLFVGNGRTLPAAGTTAEHAPAVLARPGVDVGRHIDRLLLAQYAPAGVVVDDKLEILQYRGRTGAFLEPAAGTPQNNLLKMTREPLFAALRSTFAKARRGRAPVRAQGVEVGEAGDARQCDLVVMPVPGLPPGEPPVYLVLFEAAAKAQRAQTRPEPTRAARQAPRVVELERELSATKEYLQALLEEHGRKNEELAAVNEELVSGNEELQSMNEELETAKEELQSANEELSTVNDEAHSRNDELNTANSDLVNLLNVVDIPILFLDAKRRIRRFTPKARTLLKLQASDIGRQLDDLKPSVAVPDLDRQVAETIETVTMRESEVQDGDGRWHRLQIRPYKTVENRIDGAVLSLVDIDELKHNVREAEWARDFADGIVQAVPVPLLVLDDQLRVISANDAYCQFFGASPAEVARRSLFELCDGAWDQPALRQALDETLRHDARLPAMEVERTFRRAGLRRMSLTARSVRSPAKAPMVLLAMEDVSDRQRRETTLLGEAQSARAEAERANRAKDEFLATLSHELRTPLTSLLMHSQMLRRGVKSPEKITAAAEAIERGTNVLGRLIDDLLDVSRIASGKLTMELAKVSLPAVVRAAVETVAAEAARRAVQLEVKVDEQLDAVAGDASRLQQVVTNLLTNAIKFSARGGHVEVKLDAVGGLARLQVRDEGTGIEPQFLSHIFDRFSQEDSSRARAFGGLGLGLAIVSQIVEAHGGTVRADSEGKGKGATFTVTLPVISARVAVPLRGQSKALKGGPPPLEHLRMLVVDDDEGTREALTAMLELLGADVRAASSGQEAMAALAQERPQLILCDIAMPGEDGYSLLRRIRALGPERGGSVPAVALTALASNEDRQRALAAGFQRHIAKPVDVDRLADTILQVARPESWPGA